MNRFYTSIEQSKHLLSLGMNPETADMYYCEEYIGKNNDHFYTIPPRIGPTKYGNLPCWSLGALLEVMPLNLPLYPEATEEGVKEGKYRSSDLIASTEGYLRKRFDGTYQYRYDGIKSVGDYVNPLQAAFNMVVWLLEHNLIQNVITRKEYDRMEN